MTPQERQEISTVVGNYGRVKHEYWKKIQEVERKQKEREIYWHIGDLQITDLCKQLEESDERLKFIDMVKKLDNDVEFEKHFRSACMKEFLNIDIPPENL